MRFVLYLALLLIVAVSADPTPAELKKICGSETYCVTLHSPEGGEMIIDNLKKTDSVLVLDKMVPEWFGPHPCDYIGDYGIYKDVALRGDQPLFEDYGLKPGAKVTMRAKSKEL